MFDRYIIVEDEFKNLPDRGFELGVRLPYYRGLGLSMVEEIELRVDGEPIPPDHLRLRLRGNSYALDRLEQVLEDRWEFGEVAMLEAQKSGGLKAGPHQVDVMVRLRISYLPFPLSGRDSKMVKVG